MNDPIRGAWPGVRVNWPDKIGIQKQSESGFSGFKDLQDELGVTHLNVQSLMNWATTRVAPTVLCRDGKRDVFGLHVAFYIENLRRFEESIIGYSGPL